MTSIADSDTLQQLADAVGEEPCIGAVCGGENTGPYGLCKDCRADFVSTFKNRGTYERIAFGFDEQDRFTADRIADIVFGKVAPLAIPEKARRIAPTADPDTLAVAEQMLQMDDALLIETVAAHTRNVERIESEAREMIDEYARPSMVTVQIGRAVLLDRILERRGRKIPADGVKCEVTAAKEIDKRMDVLLQLVDIVPASALADALYVSGVDVSAVVNDPEKLKQLLAIEGVKPIYSAHAGKLRTLAKDYGENSEVAKIIAKGLIDTFKTPQLVFEILPGAEKNVTPLKAVG